MCVCVSRSLSLSFALCVCVCANLGVFCRLLHRVARAESERARELKRACVRAHEKMAACHLLLLSRNGKKKRSSSNDNNKQQWNFVCEWAMRLQQQQQQLQQLQQQNSK